MLSYPSFFTRGELLKKIYALFLILLLAFLFAGAAFAVDVDAIRDANPTSRELYLLYVKGLSRENLRSFDDALFAYNVILSRAQTIVNSKAAADETITYTLPYAIAAAYRKGIITHRMIEGSVVKLYVQLMLYEDAEKWINEILTEISNVEIDRGIKLPESQYGMLYFARAYNKMGWAYALYNGNYWKRYLIYTPADTILMVDRAMDDLDKMFSIYKASFSDAPAVASAVIEPSYNFNEEGISRFELLTYSLGYKNDDIGRIKILMGRQLSRAVKASLDLYRSADVSASLNLGRKIFSYEDMMDPKSRDVVAAMGRVLKQMGSN
jgi:tetratricopeptide (TPR) repeat protein